MAGVFPEDINDTIDEENLRSDEEIEDVGILQKRNHSIFNEPATRSLYKVLLGLFISLRMFKVPLCRFRVSFVMNLWRTMKGNNRDVVFRARSLNWLCSRTINIVN